MNAYRAFQIFCAKVAAGTVGSLNEEVEIRDAFRLADEFDRVEKILIPRRHRKRGDDEDEDED